MRKGGPSVFPFPCFRCIVFRPANLGCWLCAITLAVSGASRGFPQAPAEGPQRTEDAPRAVQRPKLPPPREVNASRAKASGIRKLTGKHLTLYTDLPEGPAVDELPRVFDAAVPQWCEYFRVDPADAADWRMVGYLMQDQQRFLASGLLSPDLPIDNGYTLHHEFWMCEQPSDYYRRHLMLHEGTHGFMYALLGGVADPWYFEGLAELFGTHRWQDGKLVTRHFPADPDETPYLARIKLINEAYAERRGLRLDAVTDYGPDVHKKNEAYAWCWAAAAFMDAHPRYQARFRTLFKKMDEKNGFAAQFQATFADDLPQLAEEWQVFISDLQYGHDLPRSAIEFKPGEPLPAGGATARIAADRGWQATGIKLESGKKYRLSASGRFEVAQGPRPWISEAGGVSIKYHQGLPVGTLLAAVRADAWQATEASAFLQPLTIGLGSDIEVAQTGDLYLKINESPAELGDNKGELEVRVEQAK